MGRLHTGDVDRLIIDPMFPRSSYFLPHLLVTANKFNEKLLLINGKLASTNNIKNCLNMCSTISYLIMLNFMNIIVFKLEEKKEKKIPQDHEFD